MLGMSLTEATVFSFFLPLIGSKVKAYFNRIWLQFVGQDLAEQHHDKMLGKIHAKPCPVRILMPWQPV